MNSPIFKATFTDVYAVDHVDAQCMISSVSQSSNAYFGKDGESTSGSSSCSYQVLYWHSQAAKDSGARPQEFMDYNLNTSLYMESEAGATLAETIAKCQEHFLKEATKKTTLPEA